MDTGRASSSSQMGSKSLTRMGVAIYFLHISGRQCFHWPEGVAMLLLEEAGSGVHVWRSGSLLTPTLTRTHNFDASSGARFGSGPIHLLPVRKAICSKRSLPKTSRGSSSLRARGRLRLLQGKVPRQRAIMCSTSESEIPSWESRRLPQQQLLPCSILVGP